MATFTYNQEITTHSGQVLSTSPVTIKTITKMFCEVRVYYAYTGLSIEDSQEGTSVNSAAAPNWFNSNVSGDTWEETISLAVDEMSKMLTIAVVPTHGNIALKIKDIDAQLLPIAENQGSICLSDRIGNPQNWYTTLRFWKIEE